MFDFFKKIFSSATEVDSHQMQEQSPELSPQPVLTGPEAGGSIETPEVEQSQRPPGRNRMRPPVKR